jgi:hypothetical protein
VFAEEPQPYSYHVQAASSPLKVDPELQGQVFGYWFGPDEDIPDRPIGPPTGAVLPLPGSSFDDAELLCLDLIPVENYWLVLSELGRYTYQHTTGMLYDEEWVFIPVREVLGAWPVHFIATYAESLTPSALARYGPEVLTRARQDALAVQLRLRRITNGR